LKNYTNEILDIILENGKMNYEYIPLLCGSSCVMLLDYCLKHEYILKLNVIQYQTSISSMDIVNYMIEHEYFINIIVLFEIYRKNVSYNYNKLLLFITKYKTNLYLINYLERSINFLNINDIDFIDFILFMTDIHHIKHILKPHIEQCFDIISYII